MKTNLALSQELEDSRAPALLAARRALVAHEDSPPVISPQMATRSFLDDLGAPLIDLDYPHLAEDERAYLWHGRRHEARKARLAAAREERAILRRERWARRLASVCNHVQCWGDVWATLAVIAGISAVVK